MKQIAVAWDERMPRLQIVVGFLVLLPPLLGCNARSDRERTEARQALKRLSIPYNREAFVEHLRSSDPLIVDLFMAAGMDPDVRDTNGVTPLMRFAMEGNVDAVLLCYAKWISTLRQEPVVQTLIPAEIPQREKSEGPRADYIYEPDPESVLDALLPRYVETQVYQAVPENKASEYSAKMIAMQNATKAAGDLINDLTLYANKVRQAGITTELMEIVSGAEALRASG